MCKNKILKKMIRKAEKIEQDEVFPCSISGKFEDSLRIDFEQNVAVFCYKKKNKSSGTILFCLTHEAFETFQGCYKG